MVTNPYCETTAGAGQDFLPEARSKAVHSAVDQRKAERVGNRLHARGRLGPRRRVRDQQILRARAEQVDVDQALLGLELLVDQPLAVGQRDQRELAVGLQHAHGVMRDQVSLAAVGK